MKYFKLSILAVVAVLGFAFTSCEDDNEYTPAQTPVGAYFTEDAAQTVDLTADGTTFDVKVMRSGETAAATYPISATCELGGQPSTLFTIPTSVAFEAGKNEANITISYDGSKLVEGDLYTFSITVEGEKQFAYGSNSVVFVAGIPEPYSEWEEFESGYGTYKFGGLAFSGAVPELPVMIRTSLINPDVQQVAAAWINGQVLYIDYTPSTGVCRVEPTYVGVDYSDGSKVYIADYASMLEFFGEPSETIAEFADDSYYDKVLGTFVLHVAYFMEDGRWFGDGYEYLQMAGFDLAGTLEYNGFYVSANGENIDALLTATVGSEATSARVAISAEMGADALAEAIAADQVEYVKVKSGESEVRIPLKKSGKQTAVILTYVGSEPRVYSSIEFTYAGGAEPQSWEPVGTGYIYDAWLTGRYKYGAEGQYTYMDLPWAFEVQENVETPGVYRLMDVWFKEDCPIVLNELNKNTKSTNIIIDMTNPQCVKLPLQYSGVTWDFNGETVDVYICNNAALGNASGMSDEEIIESGYSSVLEDGIVEILPACFSWQGDPASQDIYYWNDTDPALFYFEFLDSSGNTPVRVKKDSAVSYNLFSEVDLIKAQLGGFKRIPHFSNDNYAPKANKPYRFTR